MEVGKKERERERERFFINLIFLFPILGILINLFFCITINALLNLVLFF